MPDVHKKLGKQYLILVIIYGMHASKEVFWAMVEHIDADYVCDLEKKYKLEKKVSKLNNWIDVSNMWCWILMIAQVCILFVYIMKTFN